MIRIVMANRALGKTRYAINWLLQGEWIETRPFWSRVVVVPDEAQKQVVLREIAKIKGRELPDLHALRSAIWSWEQFRMSRGYDWRRVEFCIDNFDSILAGLFSPAAKRPAFVTSTEEFQFVALAGSLDAPDRD